MTRLTAPYHVQLTTDGGGAASQDIVVTGLLYAVEVQGGTFTGGTLVVESDTSGTLTDLLTVTANQDKVFYPRESVVNDTGIALSASTYQAIVTQLTVSVSGAGATKVGDIYIHILEKT